MKLQFEELQQQVRELINSGILAERLQKCSHVYEKTDKEPVIFGHSLSSFQLSHVRSRVKNARNSVTLGKYIQKLAAKKGVFQYNPAFFEKAQITSPYWSKLINDKARNPGRETILRLAILFKCGLEETHELLAKAGYLLADSNERDHLVFACIELGIYDFGDIEELIELEGLKSLFH